MMGSGDGEQGSDETLHKVEISEVVFQNLKPQFRSGILWRQ